MFGGDTINTAARLESHGEPGKVHISEKTYNLIKEEFGLNLTQSEVSMKGKGMVKNIFGLMSGQSAFYTVW